MKNKIFGKPGKRNANRSSAAQRISACTELFSQTLKAHRAIA
jgi:hypothetical protein